MSRIKRLVTIFCDDNKMGRTIESKLKEHDFELNLQDWMRGFLHNINQPILTEEEMATIGTNFHEKKSR